MRRQPSLVLTLVAGMVASFAAVVLAPTPANADNVIPAVFTFTGSEQVFNVPANVKTVHISAIGGHGGRGANLGNAGTKGSFVDADVPIPAGVTKLFVHVGGDGGITGTTSRGYGGAGGGGAGATPSIGGIGGGASDVRTCPDGAPCGSLDSRLVVAGGGGGGGGGCFAAGCIDGNSGGDASDTSGGDAGISPTGGPGTSGSQGQGGDGGIVFLPAGGGGGGGGGGWYGGGGGAGGDGIGTPFVARKGGTGGHGSSHAVATATNVTTGESDGPASVKISYLVRSTTITAITPSVGTMNVPTVLSAKLASALGPIQGANVRFYLEAVEYCDGVTNAAGVATCSLTPIGPAGPHTLTVAYGGLANAFLPTSSQIPFLEVKRATTLTYTGATTSAFHHPATASGVLTTSDDHLPVPDAPVTFTLNGAETCTATTNASGAASCSITPNEPQGTYTLASSFPGDDSHLGSAVAAQFKVTLEATSLAIVGPVKVANNEAGTLSAKLTEDIGPGVAGRTVVIKLGSGLTAQSCSGVTATTGVATCQIASVHQPLNAAATLPVAASFAGDNFYKPSSATATGTLQYMTGRAFAVEASVLLPNLTLTIRPTPDTTSVRQAVPFTKAPACVLTLTGRVGLKSLCAKVVTSTAPGTTTSTSSVANIGVNLPELPLISVGAVTSSSITSCAGSVGDTTVAGLKIGGTPYDVSLHPAANTTIAIPGTTAKLVLNAQRPATDGDHGLTVIAVELVIPLSGGSSARVALATATSGIHNCISA